MKMLLPDYDNAEGAAFRLLIKHGQNRLTVDLRALINGMGSVKVHTYAWFMKIFGLSRSEMIRYADSDSGCFYHMSNPERRLILYNEKIKSRGRVRWTIAHELGHLVLRHFSKGVIPPDVYAVYEKEANCFARSL